MAGTTGVKTAPAIPMTANAPAIVRSPLTILSQLILPRVVITGRNTLRAAAITSNEAADLIIPLDKPANNANPDASANIPAIATPALPRASHSIEPNFLHTSANISIATDIIVKQTTDFVIPDENPANNANPDANAKIPAIATPDLPKPSQLIDSNLEHTSANISIDAPIITKATELLSILEDNPANNANPDASAKIPAIATPDLPKPSQLIEPNFWHTLANTCIAAPIINRDVELLSIFFGSIIDINFWKPTNVNNTPATPVRPLPSASQLNVDISFKAEAIILSAAAIRTI